jgi:hypothetical protein
MYVLVGQQYRGIGLGTAITRGLLSIAAERGFKWVVLVTQNTRLVAIHLYQSVGFRVLSQRQRIFLWLREILHYKKRARNTYDELPDCETEPNNQTHPKDASR